MMRALTRLLVILAWLTYAVLFLLAWDHHWNLHDELGFGVLLVMLSQAHYRGGERDD